MDAKSTRETLQADTKGALRRFGLQARKGLAQHFLIDPAVLVKISDAAVLSVEDMVLEVGPGLGVLTRELVKKSGRVIAVEMDENLVSYLQQNLARYKNLTVIHGDIMELDPARLVTEAGSRHYKVVANLPYYITSAVLRHFLEAATKPELMVIMVQKEIAEAVTALPGHMSLLAVSVQFYGRPEIITVVPAVDFYPQPKVDSAVLKIRVYPHPAIDVSNIDGFFRFVRAGFRSSRKQITNSFIQGLGVTRADFLPLLEMAEIDARRRSETLSLEEWGRLWQVYMESDVYHSGSGQA